MNIKRNRNDCAITDYYLFIGLEILYLKNVMLHNMKLIMVNQNIMNIYFFQNQNTVIN